MVGPPAGALMTREISRLKASMHRVCKIGASQLRRVTASIQQHRIAPLLIIQDGEVVGGHIVLEAARRPGIIVKNKVQNNNMYQLR